MLKQVNPNYLAAVFGKFDWSPSATQERYDEAIAFTHNSEDLNDPKSMFSITDAGLDFMERKVSENKPFFVNFAHRAVKPQIQGRPLANSLHFDRISPANSAPSC